MYRILQRKLAFIDQLENGQRHKGFGSRADAEQCFLTCGSISSYVGFANTRDPLGAVAVHDRNGYARGMSLLENSLQLLPELVNRLCRLRILSSIVSKAACREQREKKGMDSGFHNFQLA